MILISSEIKHLQWSYPKQWLQVEAMDIILIPMFRNTSHVIDVEDPLREYYSQWGHYGSESEGD